MNGGMDKIVLATTRDITKMKTITNTNSGTLFDLISVCNKILAPKFCFCWRYLSVWYSHGDRGTQKKYLEKIESTEFTTGAN